jgi:peptidoglycan/xylan/chitin deacetylase (PgdA/CDA1 family)
MVIPGNAANKLYKKSKIVFRFDDYRLTTTNFYDSLFYIFKKNNIPLCLGIIPFDKNGLIHYDFNEEELIDFKSRIECREIEIALHGFNHNYNELHKGKLLINRVSSEFAGLDYSAQYNKIRKAKKSIDSLLKVNVNIFIPPFNTYDENTLKVLDSLKFEIISASIDGSSISNRIKYIPFTINDLNELHKVINKYQNDNITIIILMHRYSFKGGSNYSSDYPKPIDFKQLDILLNWINNQKDIYATTFSVLNQNEIFDNKRFALNSPNNNLVIKTLNKLKLYRYGVYNTEDYEKKHKVVLSLLNVFLHIILFLSIYYMTKLIINILKPSKTLVAISFGIIILMSFVILNKHRLLITAIFLTTISVAFFLGILKGTKILKRT